MSGASFASARLDGADLSGAWLQGANFMLASLQGADLTGAKLQMADFASAGLQGASLALANLESASPARCRARWRQPADGAAHGADLTGAKLQGSDMRGTVVWRTLPPGGEASALADMAQIALQPPSEDDLAGSAHRWRSSTTARSRRGSPDGLARAVRRRPEQRLGCVHRSAAWQGLAKASETAIADGYKGRLTEYLARLMCRPRFADGAVAAGVARRAMAPGFKGDMPALYDRLRGTDCAATAAMSPRLLRELATAADAARGQ